MSLVNNASSRWGGKQEGKDEHNPSTDRQTERHKWKNKEAIVCLTGPALHHIGFHENTRLRESEQVVTSKSRATHPVGFYNQESYTSHKHRAANEATC